MTNCWRVGDSMHATTSSSVSAPPSDHQGDRNPEPLGDRGVRPDRPPTGSLASRDLGRLRRPTLTSVVGTPPVRRRWSYARRLDKRTAVGGARPAVLQRVYRSPTYVPKSHVCGRAPDSHPGPNTQTCALVPYPTPVRSRQTTTSGKCDLSGQRPLAPQWGSRPTKPATPRRRS
jgi:hypothetical protein